MSVFLTDGWREQVAAVRAKPDDDLVRLTAADWLDDQGEGERAELIRLMVAAPQLRMSANYAGSCSQFQHDAAGRRVCELIAGHCADWTDAWYTIEADGRNGLRWHRGFIVSATCPTNAWVRHGDALLAQEPVRVVRLTTRPAVVSVTRSVPRDVNPLLLVVTNEIAAYQFVNDPKYLWAWSTAEADNVPAGDDHLHHMLEARWPGVRFIIPTTFTQTQYDADDWPDPSEATRFVASAQVILGYPTETTLSPG